MGEVRCEQCGILLRNGECPNCGVTESPWTLRRMPVLVLIFSALLIGGFSFTRLIVSNFESHQKEIAARWFQRGNRALAASNPSSAVDDLENAVAYDQSEESYRLQLAEALVSSGRLEEARARLRSLWEERPGDARVNLQLARLSARQEDIANAERYYEAAIFGAWDDPQKASSNRISVRREFAKLLLNIDQTQKAESQLLALSAELPRDASAHAELGEMFLAASAPQRATQEFHLARNIDRRANVAPGLARAALAMHEFSNAAKWYADALRMNPNDADLKRESESVGLVLQMDPFQPDVNFKEQAARVVRAFEIADRRLQKCFPAYTDGISNPEAQKTDNQSKQVQSYVLWSGELRPHMNERKLRRQDDIQENAMRFVFQSERFASAQCKEPASDEDRALLQLSRQRWMAQ